MFVFLTDLSHSDTRLSVMLNGFELHVYNRSTVYGHLERVFGLDYTLFPWDQDFKSTDGKYLYTLYNLHIKRMYFGIQIFIDMFILCHHKSKKNDLYNIFVYVQELFFFSLKLLGQIFFQRKRKKY